MAADVAAAAAERSRLVSQPSLSLEAASWESCCQKEDASILQPKKSPRLCVAFQFSLTLVFVACFVGGELVAGALFELVRGLRLIFYARAFSRVFSVGQVRRRIGQSAGNNMPTTPAGSNSTIKPAIQAVHFLPG